MLQKLLRRTSSSTRAAQPADCAPSDIALSQVSKTRPSRNGKQVSSLTLDAEVIRTAKKLAELPLRRKSISRDATAPELLEQLRRMGFSCRRRRLVAYIRSMNKRAHGQPALRLARLDNDTFEQLALDSLQTTGRPVILLGTLKKTVQQAGWQLPHKALTKRVYNMNIRRERDGQPRLKIISEHGTVIPWTELMECTSTVLRELAQQGINRIVLFEEASRDLQKLGYKTNPAALRRQVWRRERKNGQPIAAPLGTLYDLLTRQTLEPLLAVQTQRLKRPPSEAEAARFISRTLKISLSTFMLIRIVKRLNAARSDTERLIFLNHLKDGIYDHQIIAKHKRLSSEQTPTSRELGDAVWPRNKPRPQTTTWLDQRLAHLRRNGWELPLRGGALVAGELLRDAVPKARAHYRHQPSAEELRLFLFKRYGIEVKNRETVRMAVSRMLATIPRAQRPQWQLRNPKNISIPTVAELELAYQNELLKCQPGDFPKIAPLMGQLDCRKAVLKQLCDEANRLRSAKNLPPLMLHYHPTTRRFRLLAAVGQVLHHSEPDKEFIAELSGTLGWGFKFVQIRLRKMRRMAEADGLPPPPFGELHDPVGVYCMPYWKRVLQLYQLWTICDCSFAVRKSEQSRGSEIGLSYYARLRQASRNGQAGHPAFYCSLQPLLIRAQRDNKLSEAGRVVIEQELQRLSGNPDQFFRFLDTIMENLQKWYGLQQLYFGFKDS